MISVYFCSLCWVPPYSNQFLIFGFGFLVGMYYHSFFCLVFGQITINKSRWCCMIINCFCVIFDTLYLSHLDLIRYIIDTFILWFIISREGGRIFENCCNIYTEAPDRQGFEVSWLRGFQAFRALEASRLQDFDTAFASMYW